MAMVNGVAQAFWSEVFNLHASIDDKLHEKRSSGRTKKARRVVIRRTVRMARAH